ncbi:Uncharacterised protein [Vibrio cholerae]|nr:Uncharacterised protein [Vibrio cholerae]
MKITPLPLSVSVPSVSFVCSTVKRICSFYTVSPPKKAWYTVTYMKRRNTRYCLPIARTANRS